METATETKLPLPEVGCSITLKKIRTKENQKSCIRVGRRRHGMLAFPLIVGYPVRFKLSVRGSADKTSEIKKIYYEGKSLHIETLTSIYEITF